MANTVSIGGITLQRYDCPPQFRHLVPAPEDYVPQGNELTKFATAITLNKPLRLIGHAGTGKNALIRHVANLLNRPLRIISLAEGASVDQLIGMPVAKGLPDGGFTVQWADGAFTDALRNGHWCVLDELTYIDPRVATRLNDFMADGQVLTIHENPDNPGETIAPIKDGKHNGFFLVSTENPHDSGHYAGARGLSAATLDRFFTIPFDYLGLTSPDREAEVISRAAKVKVSKARRIVDVMNAIRQQARMNDVELTQSSLQPVFATASVRKAIDIALASKYMPIMEAVAFAYTDAINGSDQPVVYRMFADQFAADGATAGE